MVGGAALPVCLLEQQGEEQAEETVARLVTVAEA